MLCSTVQSLALARQLLRSACLLTFSPPGGFGLCKHASIATRGEWHQAQAYLALELMLCISVVLMLQFPVMETNSLLT